MTNYAEGQGDPANSPAKPAPPAMQVGGGPGGQPPPSAPPQVEQLPQQSEAVLPQERIDLAHETLKRYFAAQDTTLTNLRNRASGLFLISAFVVTFASTVGLAGGQNAPAFQGWASITLWAIIALQVLLVIIILFPFHFFHGPSIDDLLDPEKIWRGIDQKFVTLLSRRLNANGRKIRGRAYLYEVAIACLVAEVSVILAAVTVRG